MKVLKEGSVTTLERQRSLSARDATPAETDSSQPVVGALLWAGSLLSFWGQDEPGPCPQGTLFQWERLTIKGATRSAGTGDALRRDS